MLRCNISSWPVQAILSGQARLTFHLFICQPCTVVVVAVAITNEPMLFVYWSAGQHAWIPYHMLQDRQTPRHPNVSCRTFRAKSLALASMRYRTNREHVHHLVLVLLAHILDLGLVVKRWLVIVVHAHGCKSAWSGALHKTVKVFLVFEADRRLPPEDPPNRLEIHKPSAHNNPVILTGGSSSFNQYDADSINRSTIFWWWGLIRNYFWPAG